MGRNATHHFPAWTLSMLLVVAACLWLPPAAWADTGPKPSADIKVTYQGGPVPGGICYARMLDCAQTQSIPDTRCTFADAEACQRLAAVEVPDESQSCTWRPAPMAWGGDCKDGLCHFSYFLPQRFRLAVYVPEGGQIYVSNSIARPNFNSTFQADLRPDGTARIVETTSPLHQGQLASFLIALLISLPLELLVAWLFVRRNPRRRRVLLAVLAANLLSLPVVWFIFSRLSEPLLIVGGGELFAVLFEAGFIYLLTRPALSVARSLVLSLVANATSFLIGGPILLMLAFLGITQ
jgi:hypothetical protein